ncbi:hypothetical protein POM88_009050 [Heracleum sosnowskyi]|uniref:25S rRNA (uridine-N(3))-methyltransferase BMT5-like domain-containing protein n=1 Tax=Heracleum sosnowskyi TaxID=360622 RepID=A0AAD8J7L3_9APIA|nr:hypothetical protein POM88_009050 [Heracleum sosnowskyi]
MHRSLLNGFFKNASGMLRPDGEIHVNHKTSNPYCNWKLEELAGQNSLRLIECVAFKKEDYPGYENKRGSSSRCDQSFPLGNCCTFKFSFSYDALVAQIRKRPQNPFEFRRPLSDGGTLIDETVMSLWSLVTKNLWPKIRAELGVIVPSFWIIDFIGVSSLSGFSLPLILLSPD